MTSDTDPAALKVFVSYAHRDEAHKDSFCGQLVDLVRQGDIALWHDRELAPGEKWEAEISDRVETCDVAVFLISSHFFESDFIYSEECGRLLERHEDGTVEIFPVILRPCRWKASPVAHLQVLPRDGLPVVSFSEENGARDQAWADIGDAFAAMVARKRSVAAEDGAAPPEIRPQPAETSPAVRHLRPAPQYSGILRALELGRVAFFLGEGVNAPDPAQPSATPERAPYPPLGTDLAQALAQSSALDLDSAAGLAEVAQRVAVRDGLAPIYADLHDALNADFALTEVHRGLARLPAAIREAGRSRHQPVFLTVNYDDLLERAFAEAGEPLDVLAYAADEANRGVFTHLPAGGTPIPLTRPNEYAGLAPDGCPLLLKLAGTVDRAATGLEHFVVTEDDHFSYVVDQDIRQLLPPAIVTRLLRCHYVFLGHSLSHWTLRSIISRVFGRGRLPARSWVVGTRIDDLDREFWAYRNVEPVSSAMPDFVSRLSAQISATTGLATGADAGSAHDPAPGGGAA